MAPVADEHVSAAFFGAFRIAETSNLTIWDGCGIDLMDVNTRARSGHLVQSMRSRREKQEMGRFASHAFILDRPRDSNENVSHRWVWTRWLPCLCAASGNQCDEFAENFLGICVERSDWKQLVWPVAGDRLVSAVRCIECYAIAPVEMV